MPNVDGKSLSPDEAMLLGLCPECGAPLIPRTARAHAESHWGADPDAIPLSEEGRRRFKLILDFAAARVRGTLLDKSQQTPKHDDESEQRERHWWQIQNRSMLWSAVPVATFLFGLDLLKDKNWIFGPIFTVGSLLALLLIDRQMRLASAPISRIAPPATRSPTIVIAFLAIATWMAVGYDIYVRDLKDQAVTPLSSTSSSSPKVQELSWDQTVTLLDGFKTARRAFIDAKWGDTVKPSETCRVSITSTPANNVFHAQLEELASGAGCDVAQPPWVDLTSADATPTPTPTIRPYILIRAAWPEGPPPTKNPDDTQTAKYWRETYANQEAEILLNAFIRIRLPAKRSKILKADDDPAQVYIELGDIAPWK